MLSPLIKQLIDDLRCLPGVGPKSAQRMAFNILERNRSNGLALWAMVRGRNVSGAAAKLPLLRHAKAAAAMERAHAT